MKLLFNVFVGLLGTQSLDESPRYQSFLEAWNGMTKEERTTIFNNIQAKINESTGHELRLYRISQHENNGYDTYDSAIVAAKTEQEAREIHPADWRDNAWHWENNRGCWVDSPEKVDVELIGTADWKIPKGVVLSSYRAG